MNPPNPGNVFSNGIKQYEVREMSNQSFIREFWDFIKIRKRYWLLPIVLILFLFGTLIVFTQSSIIAPFIYALF
jgi:hypothetical protein